MSLSLSQLSLSSLLLPFHPLTVTHHSQHASHSTYSLSGRVSTRSHPRSSLKGLLFYSYYFFTLCKHVTQQYCKNYTSEDTNRECVSTFTSLFGFCSQRGVMERLEKREGKNNRLAHKKVLKKTCSGKPGWMLVHFFSSINLALTDTEISQY